MKSIEPVKTCANYSTSPPMEQMKEGDQRGSQLNQVHLENG